MGWRLNENKFTVTIDLGSIMRVQGVRLYAYEDLVAAIQWPVKLGGFASEICEPQESGTLGIGLGGCVPTASLGLFSKVQQTSPSQGQCYNGTLEARFSNDDAKVDISARYVTVTGQCRGWCMFDEIQVLDKNGANISVGKKYRVTPASGDYNTSIVYADNSKLLTDGVVFSDWIISSFNSVGLLLNDGTKYVQALWFQPRKNPQTGSIWVTKANYAFGIGLPAYVTIQWRNENLVWTSGIQAPFISDCGGGCPCARLAFPLGAQVTGIKGTFPATKMWVMVTEISVV
jgi:hypothetical protein